MMTSHRHVVAGLLAAVLSSPVTGLSQAPPRVDSAPTASVATGSVVGSVLLPPSETRQRSFRGSLYRSRLAPDRSDREASPPPRSIYDDVVISAHSADGAATILSQTPTARMDQRQARFLPHVLPVTVGTRVDFVNQDRFYHNVFSLSEGNDFNLGRKPTGEVVSHLFEQTGAVEIFCDIHPQMNATVVVLDTPWFTQPDSTGGFRLDGLPPGRYRVRAFHPEHPQIERDVDVAGGVPLRQSFVFGR
jgi:plastocyanin